MSSEHSDAQQRESWDGAEAYEAYMARWSRLVAREFLAWLAVTPAASWLDVGCGTGRLSQAILETTAPAALLGVDPSQYFISYARKQIADPRVEFRVGKAQALPIEHGRFDAVVSGLVLNFVPDVDRGSAIDGMVRAARPGGVAAAYVWDYADGMQLMRYFWDSVIALDPQGAARDAGQRFPICNPGPLTEAFRSAGLQDVLVRPIDIATDFRDFNDYWRPFLGGQGSAPTYAVSLPEERRQELREHIRARLPVAPDGSIHLTARAWAVRGIKPG
jgi:SAM-dependent methyltransferase